MRQIGLIGLGAGGQLKLFHRARRILLQQCHLPHEAVPVIGIGVLLEHLVRQLFHFFDQLFAVSPGPG